MFALMAPLETRFLGFRRGDYFSFFEPFASLSFNGFFKWPRFSITLTIHNQPVSAVEQPEQGLQFTFNGPGLFVCPIRLRLTPNPGANAAAKEARIEGILMAPLMGAG